MPKLIIASTLVLFWAFYEMSGGADFEAPKRTEATQAPTATPEIATRSAGSPVTQVAFEVVETTPLEPVVQPAVTAPVYYTEPTIFPAPAAVSAPVAATPVAAVPAPDLRVVTGDRVNLRQGPGTQHSVLITMSQGTEATFLEANGDGWVKIQLSESNQIGWMTARLLSDG